MKSAPEFYKPAEACRIAEVAPYVLRYWETEFPVLSEGKEKGGTRLYSARDVKIISRIRGLLYDDGFTVAGAKKRLDAEIQEGRFDDGKAVPLLSEQKKKAERPSPSAVAPAAPQPSPSAPTRLAAPPQAEPLFLAESDPPPRKAAAPASDLPNRRALIKELKEIVKLLGRQPRA